ncbi:MAG: hypothetical protein ACOYL6_08920 [Bacteriovoracaceae bacterium]
MKLYLIHCGFSDSSIFEGIYESHVNFFVAAQNAEEARLKAKEISHYKEKKMHIDGVQVIEAVNGHWIRLERDLQLDENETKVHTPKRAPY